MLCFNSSSDRPNAVSSANVQGSVVVLCRRSVRFATLIGHADMHRDLNYSGSIPTATTLIPDLYVFHDTLANAEPVNLGSTDQGSVLVAEWKGMKALKQYNQKLSRASYY